MGKGILVLLAAAVLGGSTLMQSIMVTTREKTETITNHEYDVLSRQIAMSAMNIGVAETRNDFENAYKIAYSDIPFRHGLFDLTGDTLANGHVALHAIGYIDDSEYHICSTVHPGTGGPIESSLLIDSDNVDVTLNGNSFDILGLATLPPSSPGGLSLNGGGPVLSNDRAVHSVGVTESPIESIFESAVSANQEDNIVGLDGEKDVYYGDFALDLDALYAEAFSKVVTTLPGGKFNGNEVYGSADSPTILHITGDADITGSWTGYGVLLLDGDLSLSAGNFLWEGVVMVTAPPGEGLDINLTGGMEIYGSLILRTSDLPEGSEDSSKGKGKGKGDSNVNLDFLQSGNAAVMYSPEAIDRLFPMITILGQHPRTKIFVSSRRESRYGC